MISHLLSKQDGGGGGGGGLRGVPSVHSLAHILRQTIMQVIKNVNGLLKMWT